MIITLPRDLRVDIDNVPEDFEEQVQKTFSEYTKGTNPKFMYEDKLCFIDVMVRRLHHADEEDRVNDLMKDQFAYELEVQGEIADESDFLSIEFMQYCYRLGQKDAAMYSNEFSRYGGKHDNEKIMRIICRVIKAVMDYEWENDGV